MNEGISVKWKAEKCKNRHIRVQNMRELINAPIECSWSGEARSLKSCVSRRRKVNEWWDLHWSCPSEILRQVSFYLYQYKIEQWSQQDVSGRWSGVHWSSPSEILRQVSFYLYQYKIKTMVPAGCKWTMIRCSLEQSEWSPETSVVLSVWWHHKTGSESRLWRRKEWLVMSSANLKVHAKCTILLPYIILDFM